MSKSKLGSKDLLCLATVLKSVLEEKRAFYNCQYCKYYRSCSKDFKRFNILHYDNAIRKLHLITGIKFFYVDKKDWRSNND